MTTEVKFTARIDKACDKENTRYALGGAYIVPTEDDGQVYACMTDSRQLSVRHEYGVVDEPVLAPHGVLPKKAAHYRATVKFDGNHWERKTGDAVEQFPQQEGRFPKAPDVLPDVDGPQLVLHISPELLMKMASALTTNEKDTTVTLLVPVPKHMGTLPSIPEIVDAMEGWDASPKYWGFAFDPECSPRGDWRVHPEDNVNAIEADYSAWKYVVTYEVPESRVDLADMAAALLRRMMTALHSGVVEGALPVLCDGNFGVLMPCSGETTKSSVNAFREHREHFRKAWDVAHAPKDEVLDEDAPEAEDDSEDVELPTVADDEPADDLGINELLEQAKALLAS